MEPLTVPAALDALSTIGRYVVDAAAAAGLDKRASYRLRLAVDEIATNIIEHGYQEAGESGDVVIRADILDGELAIVIPDLALYEIPNVLRFKAGVPESERRDLRGQGRDEVLPGRHEALEVPRDGAREMKVFDLLVALELRGQPVIPMPGGDEDGDGGNQGEAEHQPAADRDAPGGEERHAKRSLRSVSSRWTSIGLVT